MIFYFLWRYWHLKDKNLNTEGQYNKLYLHKQLIAGYHLQALAHRIPTTFCNSLYNSLTQH